MKIFRCIAASVSSFALDSDTTDMEVASVGYPNFTIAEEVETEVHRFQNPTGIVFHFLSDKHPLSSKFTTSFQNIGYNQNLVLL